MKTFLRSAVPLFALLILVPAARAGSPPEKPSGGWIGLQLSEGVAGEEGVLVRAVVEGSPADDARLRAKDSIVAVDGTAVSRPAEVVARLRAMEPGSAVTLSVKRRGRDFELRPVVGSRPETPEGWRMVRGWLGVEVIELPASLRAHFGAPETAGVLVSAVTEASPAYDSGIRVGDVIYELDGEPVTSARALSQLVSEAGVENVVDVVLARDGARIIVGPQIERAPEAAPR